MWTIFNAAGQAIANSDFEPNPEDLQTRAEQAFYHAEPISLPEALLIDGAVKRKPLVTLTAVVAENKADITVACDDPAITELPLLIGSMPVTKAPGVFSLMGEPGVKVLVDFARDKLRGQALEVCF